MIGRTLLAVLLTAGQCSHMPQAPNRHPVTVITSADPITYGITADRAACYTSTDGAATTPTALSGWNLGTWTGSTTTDERTGGWYGSTSCGQSATGVWSFLTNSCLDAECTANAAGRTAQLIYGLGGYRRPFVGGGRLRVAVDFNVTERLTPAGVDQFGLVWIALRDTRGTADRDDDIRIWYAVTLWDTRGRDITAFPPVISDWYAGGGTPFFNVLGYVDGGGSRAVRALPWSASTFDGGGSYRFEITGAHLRAAVASLNALIASDPIYAQFPQYSTDLANFELRAAAVDVEVNDRPVVGASDFVAFTVSGFTVQQIGGAS
jgi:hypothetical protein